MRWLLYVLLGLLALIVLLLITPVGARATADDNGYAIYAHVFGLNVKILPRPPKKKKKPKKPKKPKEPKPEEEKKKEKKPFKLTFGKLLDYISFAADALKRAVRGIYIRRFRLYARLHNDDAAKTALMYGGACSVLGNAIPKLEKIFRVGDSHIELVPDFDGSNSYSADVIVTVVPIKLLITGLILFIKWKKLNRDKAVQK